jgi:Predicted RNA-binding protein homologous to eukaryotic snRNP
MPIDYPTLSALASELSSILAGGRINKIYMPRDEAVELVIRAGGENYNLLISAETAFPASY